MAACCSDSIYEWGNSHDVEACLAESARVRSLPVIKRHLDAIEALNVQHVARLEEYERQVSLLQRALRKDYEKLRRR